jgi:hypothetical protein
MAADLPDRLATDGYARIPAGRKGYGCQRWRHVLAGGRCWNELGLGGESVKVGMVSKASPDVLGCGSRCAAWPDALGCGSR